MDVFAPVGVFYFARCQNMEIGEQISVRVTNGRMRRVQRYLMSCPASFPPAVLI